jgi:hypothetical protein
LNALQDCSDKSSQAVWFQSIDELQQHLVPALFARGLARGTCNRCSSLVCTYHTVTLTDFWTSGIFNPTFNRWQWLLSNNNTRIDIESSIISQFNINALSNETCHRDYRCNTETHLHRVLYFSGSITLLFVRTFDKSTNCHQFVIGIVLHTLQNIGHPTCSEQSDPSDSIDFAAIQLSESVGALVRVHSIRMDRFL